MYYFYVFFIYLLLPFLTAFYYFRGIENKTYHARWKEYLGIYKDEHTKQVIWLHAASVGEVEAANVLISHYRDHSSCPVLVTTSTEAGYQRVRALQLDQVEHVYFPLDTPDAIARFLNRFQPKLAIIMETEIWPILFSVCSRRAIPLFIINARLSEKSTNRYLKIRVFLQKVFVGVSGVFAQTELDAQRYREIGVRAHKITVSGNIKLDMVVPKSIIEQASDIKYDLFPNRLIFVVGSTHEGEESIFLSVYQRLKKQFPTLLLVLVPRHPKRADSLLKLCAFQQLKVVKRTESQPCAISTDVFLVDTIGELKQMYAVADCSFVAGSMVPIGGHNIFEPVLLGSPVLFGAYMKNSALLAQQLLDAKGAIQCFDEADIVNAVTLIFNDVSIKQSLIYASQAFVEKNKGAVQRTIELINY